jgi:hypothetical protein
MRIVFKETGDFRDFAHYFHFMELLWVAIVKLEQSGADPKSVTTISVPQWKGDSWKGKEQPHNEWILSKVFPNAIVNDVDDTDAGLVVDRNDYPSGKINKTWRLFIREFNPHYWHALVKVPIATFKKPVVTYINRQSSKNRRLSDQMHCTLVQFLKGVPDIEFRNVSMEKHSFETQVAIVQETDLLIGVHGNGLTHAAFMKPHRNVVEIFVPGITFHWDYYTTSKMMGHEYTCIFNGSPALPYMFTMGNAVCHTDLFPPEIFNGIIHQIREELVP